MLGLLGLVGGFFSGSFLFAMISGVTGGAWDAEWGYWFLSCITGVAGLVLAFRYGIPLVQASTALIGSYLFMRSWTLFFPGDYPSEAELVKFSMVFITPEISSSSRDLARCSSAGWLCIGSCRPPAPYQLLVCAYTMRRT